MFRHPSTDDVITYMCIAATKALSLSSHDAPQNRAHESKTGTKTMGQKKKQHAKQTLNICIVALQPSQINAPSPCLAAQLVRFTPRLPAV